MTISFETWRHGPAQLELFAWAISQKGAALDNCWGFVDGTVRLISRPGEHQRVIYNGHKRVHGLKFQSVVAPNGLIANLYMVQLVSIQCVWYRNSSYIIFQ